MRKLIKFETSTCVPCKRVQPEVEALASKHELQLEVFTLDKDPDLLAHARSLGVNKVPSFQLDGLVFDSLGELRLYLEEDQSLSPS